MATAALAARVPVQGTQGGPAEGGCRACNRAQVDVGRGRDLRAKLAEDGEAVLEGRQGHMHQLVQAA